MTGTVKRSSKRSLRPKKKSSTKKKVMRAATLGVAVTSGVAAGTYLVKRRQEQKRKREAEMRLKQQAGLEFMKAFAMASRKPSTSSSSSSSSSSPVRPKKESSIKTLGKKVFLSKQEREILEKAKKNKARRTFSFKSLLDRLKKKQQ